MMDEQTLQVLRIFGYLLNMSLFASVAIKYPHHWRALGAWVLWMGVASVAILLRLNGSLNGYFLVVDIGLTLGLYINAVLAGWVLLKRNGRK